MIMINDIMYLTAKKYRLRSDILYNILLGKVQGWSQYKISEEYRINQNTISKYVRILEKEIKIHEIKKMLIFIGSN